MSCSNSVFVSSVIHELPSCFLLVNLKHFHLVFFTPLHLLSNHFLQVKLALNYFLQLKIIFPLFHIIAKFFLSLLISFQTILIFGEHLLCQQYFIPDKAICVYQQLWIFNCCEPFGWFFVAPYFCKWLYLTSVLKTLVSLKIFNCFKSSCFLRRWRYLSYL